MVVTYKTDASGTPAATITNSKIFVSDGDYHQIRFVRTGDKGVLYVNGEETINTHIGMYIENCMYWLL